jgi:hypothetical protein
MNRNNNPVFKPIKIKVWEDNQEIFKVRGNTKEVKNKISEFFKLKY